MAPECVNYSRSECSTGRPQAATDRWWDDPRQPAPGPCAPFASARARLDGRVPAQPCIDRPAWQREDLSAAAGAGGALCPADGRLLLAVPGISPEFLASLSLRDPPGRDGPTTCHLAAGCPPRSRARLYAPFL